MPEKLVGPAGKVALESALPPDYRDLNRVWDADTTKKVLTEIAYNDPDKYKDVANDILHLGRIGATHSGGYNYSLRELIPPEELQEYRKEVANLVAQYANEKGWMDRQDEEFANKLNEVASKYVDRVIQRLDKSNNPVYRIVAAGIKGNPTTIKRFLFTDAIYPDSWDRAIPWPVTRNFSTGLTPHEYWAASYGSKKGIVTTKLAPGDAGFIYKQLAQLAHKLMVIKNDGAKVGQMRGVPVSIDDPDNIGAFLAVDTGPFKANTPITTGVIDKLRQLKIDKILIRSPIAGGPPQGVYAYDVGRRGPGLPDPGTLVGLEAAQAIGERLSQSSVGKKHQGMVVGGVSSALDVVFKFLNPPKNFKNAATHAEVSGTVTAINKSPAGGYDVYIDGKRHYVPSVAELRVKVGDKVEAGDAISTGIINPAKIVQHKGIGEGRRYFTEEFTKLLRSFGFPVHRRNVEIIARGLINHVQFDEKFGSYYPGDVVEYNYLEHNWKPRPDARRVDLSNAKGKYLEEPVLHYTIGTQLTPSIIKQLKEYNIKDVLVNEKPLPFHPLPVQAVEAIGFDEDWLVRLLGSYQKRSLQEALAYGSVSDKYNTVSFVPALAEGVNFGKKWPQAVINK